MFLSPECFNKIGCGHVPPTTETCLMLAVVLVGFLTFGSLSSDKTELRKLDRCLYADNCGWGVSFTALSPVGRAAVNFWTCFRCHLHEDGRRRSLRSAVHTDRYAKHDT